MLTRIASLIALVALLALAGPPAPPANWTDGYVTGNGIRIHYWRTGGNKTPLILAHVHPTTGCAGRTWPKSLRQISISSWWTRAATDSRILPPLPTQPMFKWKIWPR